MIPDYNFIFKNLIKLIIALEYKNRELFSSNFLNNLFNFKIIITKKLINGVIYITYQLRYTIPITNNFNK